MSGETNMNSDCLASIVSDITEGVVANTVRDSLHQIAYDVISEEAALVSLGVFRI